MITTVLCLLFLACAVHANAGPPLQLGNHPGGALATQLDLYDFISRPAGVIPLQRNTVECEGDNRTFVGCMSGYFQARDHVGVNSNNKGVLYGLGVSVVPTVDRDNVPFDDVAAIAAINDGTAKGTEAIYVGRGSRIAGSEWIDVFGSDANADWGIRIGGTLTQSVLTTRFADLPSGRAIELKTGHAIAGLDKRETFWTDMLKFNDREQIEIGAPWRENIINGFSRFGQVAQNNGVISGRQIANGADTLFLQRASDRNPVGSLLRFTDAANTRNLYRVNADGSLAMAATVGAVQGREQGAGVLRFEPGSTAGTLRLVVYGPNGAGVIIADNIQ